MSINHWIFWPSILALMYFGGGWLIARFWEAGAMAAVALGDMAPARPRAYDGIERSTAVPFWRSDPAALVDGDVAGLIVTARAQLYALEGAIARADVELVESFTRRLLQTSGELRALLLLEFPTRAEAGDLVPVAAPVLHFRV